MYGILLVSDFKYKLSWLFLRHDGYIYLCSIVCCEIDSGFKVLENDVG